MAHRLFVISIVMLALFLPVASFATAVPTPPYPGASPSLAYKVAVDGQSVFAYRYPTYNQFNWMDYASFSMTGKVHVEITSLISERDVRTCYIRPLAYNIHPVIKGNTISFDLDRPRYLVVFVNEEPLFSSTGLLLFADPPEANAPKLGDPNVVNIMDYKVDNTGKTVETAKINQAISDVSAKGGGVVFLPKGGAYLTGLVDMKSNVKLYIEAGAVLKGSTKNADYVLPPGVTPGGRGGGRAQRALFFFNNVENASIMGRGTVDAQGYPWLWHDMQPETGDGKSRTPEGLVIDPHGAGVKGYVVNNCKNITFQDLTLLRAAYWTITVSNTDTYTSRNIKLVSRKQQYHDDAYDLTGGDKHILIEHGFSMTMDDAFAFYGGAGAALDDVVVKDFVDYGYSSGLVLGYGGIPAAKHVRFEDVHFVSTQNKFAIWIQFTPAYFTGRGYPSNASSKQALDDFHFINCSWEHDGGQIYIDAGDSPLTNFVFENCTFYTPSRPSKIFGKNMGPILFKNVKLNSTYVRSVDQLTKAGWDIAVPMKFEVTAKAAAGGPAPQAAKK
jgi:hypothetical protein